MMGRSKERNTGIVNAGVSAIELSELPYLQLPFQDTAPTSNAVPGLGNGRRRFEDPGSWFQTIGEQKAAERVLNEVGDWLELTVKDDEWLSKKRRAYEAIHARPASFETVHDASETPTDLHVIAMQMLACCYTLYPTPSAEHRPFHFGKRNPGLITSLRMHSHYRFSPAAGHHARDPSETSAWPGLYEGPSLEDRLAEEVSRKRMLREGAVKHDLSSSQTDGPSDSGVDIPERRVAQPESSAMTPSSTATECCCIQRWAKSHKPLSTGSVHKKDKESSRTNKSSGSPSKEPHPRPSTRPVRSPPPRRVRSPPHLRHLPYSAPESTIETLDIIPLDPIASAKSSRRNSSRSAFDTLEASTTSNIMAPMTPQSRAVPEIRRISASTGSKSNRISSFTSPDYHGELPLSPGSNLLRGGRSLSADDGDEDRPSIVTAKCRSQSSYRLLDGDYFGTVEYSGRQADAGAEVVIPKFLPQGAANESEESIGRFGKRAGFTMKQGRV